MQSWLRSGEFTLRARLWDAVRANLVYYATIGVPAIFGVLYLFITKKIESPYVFIHFVARVVTLVSRQLLDLAMAGANAYGLLLLTIMLGYGFVSLPKQLWKMANAEQTLLDYEVHAPLYREAMVDTESEVYEVAKVRMLYFGFAYLSKDISFASRKVPDEDPMRPLMDRVLAKCPMAKDGRGFAGDDKTPTPMTRDYIIALHARVKRAAKLFDRNKAYVTFKSGLKFLKF